MKRQRLLIWIAEAIYSIVPVRQIRERLFRAFLWGVRGRRLVATIDGISYDLDLSEIIDVCIYVDRYEPDVRRVTAALCAPGWIVLDVGANVGAHTLPIARRVGPSGLVVAFEPTAFAFEKLRRNVGLNPSLNVRVSQAAVAERGQLAAPFSARSSWRSDGIREEQVSSVPTIALDEWFEREEVSHVDLIKIDVDGAEWGVLRGAAGLLSRYHPRIIIEATPDHFVDPSKDPFALLIAHGYHFRDLRTGHEIRTSGEVRSAVERESRTGAGSINLLGVDSCHSAAAAGLWPT